MSCVVFFFFFFCRQSFFCSPDLFPLSQKEKEKTHSPRSLAILPIIAAFPEGGTELSNAIPERREADSESEESEEEEEQEESEPAPASSSPPLFSLFLFSFSLSASFSTTIPPKLCPTTMGGLEPALTRASATAATSSACDSSVPPALAPRGGGPLRPRPRRETATLSKPLAEE